MLSPDICNSAILKVKRAYRHIDEIRTRSAPLSPDLFVVETREYAFRANRQTALTQFVYKPIEPVAEVFALMIGDAVHNLRSALDHLATAIVRTGGNTNAQVHFPMAKIREDLLSPEKRNSGFQKALESIDQALPGAKRLFLEQIRPKNGPDEAFWAFHALDNDDKHNLLIPSVVARSVSGINANAVGGNSYRNGSIINFDANREYILLATQGDAALQGNFYTTADVYFGTIDTFTNEPVIPTLVHLAEVVVNTIGAFAHLIENGV